MKDSDAYVIYRLVRAKWSRVRRVLFPPKPSPSRSYADILVADEAARARAVVTGRDVLQPLVTKD